MKVSLTEFQIEDEQTGNPQIPDSIDKKKHGEPTAAALDKPLERIAICMSGGGFRAASFALGTLAYLNHAQGNGRKLIDNVCYISSASGGTITASLFALAKNKPDFKFETFFNNTVNVLKGEKLLETALTVLNDKRNWAGTKSRNLINAFAKAYDHLLYQEATFGELYNNKLTVCFNATEFYRGLSFRFQTHGFIGNKFVKLDKNARNTTNKIKVADVMAASSCFPLGFEPIVFPDDFTYDSLTTEALKATIQVTDYDGEHASDAVIPLMDGGITDNQGLYSAMLADLNGRDDGKTPIDLFLVTDVASYFMDHYKIPKPPVGVLWKLKLNTARVLIILLGHCTMTASVLLLIFATEILLKVLGGFLFFPSLIITGWHIISNLLALYRWLVFNRKISFASMRNLFNLNEGFSDSIFAKLERFFKRSRLGVLQQMVKSRISSMSTMVNDVNLKQTRRLINDLFYSNDLFDDRRCANYVYSYSEQNLESKTNRINARRWPDEDKKRMIPSQAMARIAESARTMGTTLWFESKDEDRLNHLLATGKFTTCGCLLEYILDLEYSQVWKKLDPSVQRNLLALKVQLAKDWEAFKLAPLSFS